MFIKVIDLIFIFDFHQNVFEINYKFVFLRAVTTINKLFLSEC